MSRALKGVEAWLADSASSGFTNIKGKYIDNADLREVAALAKREVEREKMRPKFETLFDRWLREGAKTKRKPLPRRRGAGHGGVHAGRRARHAKRGP